MLSASSKDAKKKRNQNKHCVGLKELDTVVFGITYGN